MKKNLSLLKTMLKTSYNTGDIIDSETKKLNKKSMKVWLVGLVCIIAIYLSYLVINSLKQIGLQSIFLEIFFLLLQILVMFETVLLVISVLYFSDDIENYLCLPISSRKLLFTKFSVMLSIIFGSEIIIALPVIFMYGVRTLASAWFYPLAIIVLVSVSIFLSTIVSIVMIFVMRIFRFIKNKYLYRNVIILLMTFIIFIPLANVISVTMNNMEVVEEKVYDEQIDSSNTEAIEELQSIAKVIKGANKYFIVTELAVNSLTEINYKSIIYVLEIIGLDLLALAIFFTIGKFTYIKDILWNLSIFDMKKNKKISLKKDCKVRNKRYSYLRNEINGIVKNPTYFMHYIYNLFVLLISIILIVIMIFPIVVQVLKDTAGEDIFKELTFGFGEFSFIIGIIQVIFTLSSISLTAMSRYGKSAIFFKYIPIKLKTQFKLKNTPELFINTIIICAILGTIKYLIPAIQNVYILLMFIVAMLLNIINSNILLFLDLARPSLNYENEVTVIKQNDNKLFQYILTVVSCIIIWYLKKVTENLSLNISILIEICIFMLVVIGMEVFINKRSNRLFRKIM